MTQSPDHCPATYCICVRGQLGPEWSDWFEGLALSAADGETRLTGPLPDQAALHGILTKLRDLGLPLVSVTSNDQEGTHE